MTAVSGPQTVLHLGQIIPSDRDGRDRFALTVLVPTRNEAGNIELLLSRLNKALVNIFTEVLFVDDSTDDTPEVIHSLRGCFQNLTINLIHREGTDRIGGLGGAVVAGLRAAHSPFVCVMDADLQHPPELVRKLFVAINDQGTDIVVASRRTADADAGELGVARNLVSRALDTAARVLFPGRFHNVSDPLTGFFILRKELIEIDNLHPKGFKILLEILVRNPNMKKMEIPFHFGARHAGKSKASSKEVFRYLQLLLSLRFSPATLRFFGFALVGFSGIAINSLVMLLATETLRIHYLISALLATLGSTTWNFLLSEALVFRSWKPGIGKRFTLFLGMNGLALLGRGPIIYVLTVLMGVHYLISNLFSLLLLTVGRFLLADKVIWNTPSSRKQEVLQLPTGKISQKGSRLMKDQMYYNIHNIITVSSESHLPELEAFRVAEPIQHPTITLQLGKIGSIRQPVESSSRHFHYKEIFGSIGFEADVTLGEHIHIVASPTLRFSPHVLYTNLIEPILRWAFVERGYALVHGASIAFGDKAYMITALTDTGKTTTLLKILNHQRRGTDSAAFISDDMTILTPEGEVLTYPKPLTISFHTLRAVNSEVLNRKERVSLALQSRLHSRSGRKAAFLMSQTRLPMASINMLVQFLVPPPKYHVERLIPRVKLQHRARLVGLFVIERSHEERSDQVENKDALDILLRNCEDAYGFPPYYSIAEYLYNADGVDLREVERGIIVNAMNQLPATLIRSSSLDWWRRIPAFVSDEVAAHFEERGAPQRLPERATQPLSVNIFSTR